MTAEIVVPPLALPDAKRALGEALEGIGRHARNYERLRERLDVRATARARTELGLAVLEVVSAMVALAEAEDRVDPAWAAARGRPMFMTADPSHDLHERAWRDYQEARRAGDHGVVAAARNRWRYELVSWAQLLHERRASEDEERAEELSRRLDESRRLDPSDAFRSRPRSRAQEVAHTSRERERQESIRRSTGDLNAWVPWRPGSR